MEKQLHTLETEYFTYDSYFLFLQNIAEYLKDFEHVDKFIKSLRSDIWIQDVPEYKPIIKFLGLTFIKRVQDLMFSDKFIDPWNQSYN